MGGALKPALSEWAEVITAGRQDCDIQLDLADPIEKISFPEGIDTVIHLAAAFGGQLAKEIMEAENINVLGTLKLCEASVRANVKHFIFISSIYAGLREGDPHYSIYALSKRHAEELTGFFCSVHLLPLTIIRPSQIYGATENFRKHQPFLYTLADKAEKGEDISFFGTHDPLRNYIYIDDLVNIIEKVVQNKVTGFFSCTNTADVSFSQIARAALEAFGSNGSVHFLKDKPDIADNIFEKDLSLYKKIDFYPTVTIEEGMKKIAHQRKMK